MYVCFSFITKVERIRCFKTQFSSVMSDSLQPHGLQHTRPPCPSPTPEVHSNSCSMRWWCHPSISSSTVPFSSCLQSVPASESFTVSQFFESGDQSIGVSVSASVLPVNIQVLSKLKYILYLPSSRHCTCISHALSCLRPRTIQVINCTLEKRKLKLYAN